MAIVILALILLVGVGYWDSYYHTKKNKEERNEKDSKIL